MRTCVGAGIDAAKACAWFVGVVAVLVALACNIGRQADDAASAVGAGEALRLAAMAGDERAMGEALGRGVWVDDADVNGATPLMVAAQGGSLSAVRFLLDRGASVSGSGNAVATPLGAAASNGHTDVVRELLRRGADPNGRSRNGYTAVWQACMSGAESVEALRVLLAGGADPNARVARGRTPLMLAAGAGAAEAVGALLAAGADRWARDEDGTTAMDWAVEAGRNGTDVSGVMRLLADPVGATSRDAAPSATSSCGARDDGQPLVLGPSRVPCGAGAASITVSGGQINIGWTCRTSRSRGGT